MIEEQHKRAICQNGIIIITTFIYHDKYLKREACGVVYNTIDNTTFS